MGVRARREVLDGLSYVGVSNAQSTPVRASEAPPEPKGVLLQPYILKDW